MNEIDKRVNVRMILKIIRRLKIGFEFRCFKALLSKYHVDFYFVDRFGIISKRELSDNFYYMFKTKNSCDAAPLMDALANLEFNIAFDVGANIGIVTSYLARKSRVCYAFEPEKNNAKRLREQLTLNNINNVELAELALCDSRGESELYILSSHGHHSMGQVKTSEIVGKIQIETTTLDEFCHVKNIEKIDLLKVDVEGFELEVLRGGKRMLQSQAISLIVFEISKVPLASLRKSANEILAFLRSYGYQIYRLNGDLFFGDPDEIVHEDLLAKVPVVIE